MPKRTDTAANGAATGTSWVLHNIKQIVDMEETLVKAGSLQALVEPTG